MSENERLRFPQYLHRPFRIVWFEIDELILMIALYVVVVMTTYKAFPIIPLAIYFYKKEKAKRPRGFFKHTMFNLGLIDLKGYPSAFSDRFEE